jgi:hypothetical protein
MTDRFKSVTPHVIFYDKVLGGLGLGRSGQIARVHRLNAEGHYAEFLTAECRIPEPRMGLNAETLYAELDLIPKSCMPNWT